MAPILVTGGTGQLGEAFGRLLPPPFVLADRQFFDLSNSAQMARVIEQLRPAIVVNCAAYTQVDKAEDEPELCQLVNAVAVEHLARICNQFNAMLVQISTDYVFGIEPPQWKAWAENDTPQPQGIYAKSKLAGEQAARLANRHLIVRTCGLYGGGPLHTSFLEKMLQFAQDRKELRIVSDQHCSPSLVDDVAEAIVRLIASEQHGIFHITNTGQTTWYHFAKEIFRLLQLDVPVTPVTTQAFCAKAPRPLYSVLDTSKYHALQLGGIRSWQAALEDHLTHRRQKC